MKSIKILLENFLNFLVELRNSFRYRKLGINLLEFFRLKRSFKSETTLFGKRIKIESPFWYLFSIREIFIDEHYLFKTDSAQPYIIDCGANIGLSTIYFKKLYPHSEIDCFEPDSKIFQSLKYNLDQFDFSDIRLHQKAVWKDSRNIRFTSVGNLGGYVSTNESGEDHIQVETIRLKDFLIKPVDFLKIDIEGAENVVLEDCADSLTNVKNIFIEYHRFHNEGQKLARIIEILENAGFRIYIKEAWENLKFPFVDKKNEYFDLQLNIYGFRK